MNRTFCGIAFAVFCVAAFAADDAPWSSAGLPGAEYDDAIMASAAEVGEVQDWTASAFRGVVREGAAPRIELEVLRQDHSVLRFGESCIETPLKIGTKSFEHGLGTHATSEISVKVPKDAARFSASVGIDNNHDTQGTRGSVQFSVEIAGAEVFRTPTVQGGEEPVAVDVNVPEGTDRIVLKVDATEDGASHDQANWADARFIMKDGAERRLDENQSQLLFLGTQPPFSFVYGEKPSAEFIESWTRESSTEAKSDRTIDTVTWTDPATGLRVTGVVTAFTRYPATDWVLFFENTGTQDTPILEDIQALDVRLRTGYMRHAPVLHELEGDACGERTFHPKDTSLEAGKSLRMAPTGGRPSSISAFPFLNFEYEGRGLITAIGWTGQWAAQVDRSDTGPTRMRVGMERTHFVLRPGERVRTPRIVMMAWAGDRQAAHNRFRRLVLFKYVPQADSAPARLPTALQTFDRYNARPGWATEAGQLEAVKVAQRLGCETYWLDAAWFPGNFPNGVGNWYCKPQEFPNGLKPVGDACKNVGMRFVLWFEPERVARGTQIAEEHPEFVLGGKNGGLFNLGDPAARAWLTDLLSRRISEYGVTLYRNDFNMDPLSFWQGNDAPDRQGITEIRYVEGLYAMWDELLARHPGLLIDNCSSGGRRIDIEMCSRSVPLWRSDTNCSSGHPDWNQLQSFALGQYVPLSTSCVWAPKAYDVRSSATGGLLCQFAYLEEGFPMELASELVAEARVNQPFWYGDFYPLTPCSNRPDEFVAYQLHRPDLGAGVVIAFRRAECNYLGLILGLNALRPDANYRVQFVDEQGAKTEQTLNAAQLAEGLPVRITEKGNSTIIRYAEVR